MENPIFTAIKENNILHLKELLNSGADSNAVNKNGWTTLMGASENEHLKIAKLLIKNGADANAVDDDGNLLSSQIPGEEFVPHLLLVSLA